MFAYAMSVKSFTMECFTKKSTKIFSLVFEMKWFWNISKSSLPKQFSLWILSQRECYECSHACLFLGNVTTSEMDQIAWSKAWESRKQRGDFGKQRKRTTIKSRVSLARMNRLHARYAGRNCSGGGYENGM